MPMNQMRTFDELVNVLELQAANLTVYMADVGATLADITAVQDMLANLKAVQDFAEVIDADKKTIFGIKLAMFSGTVGGGNTGGSADRSACDTVGAAAVGLPRDNVDAEQAIYARPRLYAYHRRSSRH